MLRDRSEPVDLFMLVPALELRFEPELAELDRLLEDDQIFQQVKADLSRRRPHTTDTGRPSTPVEVILRLLVVQHLYDWSYAQTEHFVGDSLVLRQFCRLGLDPVPHHTTLMRWANLLQPETMHRLLDRVTELARSLKVTRGRKLRIDSTVVASAIHYPTDSTLLFDGVRVLSRLVQHAATALSGSKRRLARVGLGWPNSWSAVSKPLLQWPLRLPRERNARGCIDACWQWRRPASVKPTRCSSGWRVGRIPPRNGWSRHCSAPRHWCSRSSLRPSGACSTARACPRLPSW